MLDHKYLHTFTAEMDFLKFMAHPRLNPTPVITFQWEMPEWNYLYSVILNLQDRLGDLRVSSLFRVYVTKKYWFFLTGCESVHQEYNSLEPNNVWSAIQV